MRTSALVGATMAMVWAGSGCATSKKDTREPVVTPPKRGAPLQRFTGTLLDQDAARAKLRALSHNKVQLWVVVPVAVRPVTLMDGSVDMAQLTEVALFNAEAARSGGADVVVLHNMDADLETFSRVVATVQLRYPRLPLGLAMGGLAPQDLSDAFVLAHRHQAQVVVTHTAPGQAVAYRTQDGSWQPAQVIPVAWALGVHRGVRPGAMHVSGVHMPDVRPLDEGSAAHAVYAALGTVDGVNVPANGATAQAARNAAGAWPLGAVGVTQPRQLAAVAGYVDYTLADATVHPPALPAWVDADRVLQMRQELDRLGGDAQGIP